MISAKTPSSATSAYATTAGATLRASSPSIWLLSLHRAEAALLRGSCEPVVSWA